MCGEIKVDVPVTRENDLIAEENSKRLRSNKTLCINIMGSPGAGKTTVIEKISEHMEKDEIIVVQGDLESDMDKKRIEDIGIECHQINTKSSCHLHAKMIKDVLDNVNLEGKKYLLIENVGNLVCPVGVKLGQEMDMVISSTAEGADKPVKYPSAFRKADIVVITKYDLSEGFDEKMYFEELSKLNRHAQVIKFSIKNPECYHDLAKVIRDAYIHRYEGNNETCVHCGSPVPHDSGTCHICEKVPSHTKRGKERCPHCGAIIKSDDTICHNCLGELDKYKDETPAEFRDRA